MRKLGLYPLFFIVALTGCDQFRANERMALAILGSPCPPTGVLSDAVTVSKLRPGAVIGNIQNPADVIYTAEASRPELECRYDRRANTLVVDVAFNLRAIRGAAQAPEPPLDFFISIVDLEENVLVKNVYRYQPNLAANPAIQWTQNLRDLVVPLARDRRPGDYEILVGFQLTEDELAYNRLPKTSPIASR